MPLPFVMSDEACTVTGKLPGRQTETSPAAVCNDESVKTPWLLTNSTVIGPAPVSTCAPRPRLYNSTLPPPVETFTWPFALARRTLPPPVSACKEPLTSPKLRLPPALLARRSPSHLRTSIPPPPVVMVEPLAVPMYTLPPPSVTRACPAMLLMWTSPPPLLRVKSAPRLPPSTLPPPEAILTGPLRSSSFTAPPPVVPRMVAVREFKLRSPLRVSTRTNSRSRGTCTTNSALKRFRFLPSSRPSMELRSALLATEICSCSNCCRAAASVGAKERLRITYLRFGELPCTRTEPMSVLTRTSRPTGMVPVISSTHELPSR